MRISSWMMTGMAIAILSIGMPQAEAQRSGERRGGQEMQERGISVQRSERGSVPRARFEARDRREAHLWDEGRMERMRLARLLSMEPEDLEDLRQAIVRVQAMSEEERKAMLEEVREEAVAGYRERAHERVEARAGWMEMEPGERLQIGKAMRELDADERMVLREELRDLSPQERIRRLRELAKD